MSLSERLFTFIHSKKLSINGFEKKVGVSVGLFARAIKTDADIGSGKLKDISIAFPDINLHWLITGSGSMLLKDSISNNYADNDKLSLASDRGGEKEYKRQDKLIDDLLKSKDVIIKLNKEIADLRFLVAKSGLSDQL